MKKLLFFLLPFIAFSCSRTEQRINRTDALPDEAWEVSEWISVADAPVVTDTVYDGSRAADGANWFVASIAADKPIQSAIWMTAGLGVYQLYVNENQVGDEVLKPGFTHYAKTKRSFTYDITSAVKNQTQFTLAAQITPGWWADKIITPAGTKGMYGHKCAFRAVLKLQYEDGTEQLIGTDTILWRAGIAGPVTHAAIFDGEEYDARIPMGYDCLPTEQRSICVVSWRLPRSKPISIIWSNKRTIRISDGCSSIDPIQPTKRSSYNPMRPLCWISDKTVPQCRSLFLKQRKE